jgi:hypothetical protein
VLVYPFIVYSPLLIDTSHEELKNGRLDHKMVGIDLGTSTILFLIL